jgi:hypothetical protein
MYCAATQDMSTTLEVVTRQLTMLTLLLLLVLLPLLQPQDMRTALEGITSQLSPDTSWQASLPVFHCLALPEGAELLQQVLLMHSQEVAVKQDLLRCFNELVQEAGSCLQDNPSAAAPAGSHAAKQSSSSSSRIGGSVASGSQRHKLRSVEDCRKLLTGGITTWMVRPCIEDGRMEQLLQLLTDEMVGF